MHEPGLSKQFIEVIPRTMVTIRREMRAIARTELTVVQFRVLANLWLGPLSNKELAEAIGCSVPGMSRTVDGLVKKGLVTRAAASADRRQIAVSLSSRGQAKYESLRAAAEKGISRRLGDLSPRCRTELAAGLRVLERLYGLKS